MKKNARSGSANKEREQADVCSKLLRTELKLKALAHLIGNQNASGLSPTPWDLEGVYSGLRELMEELTEEISITRNLLEKQNIENTPQQKSLGLER